MKSIDQSDTFSRFPAPGRLTLHPGVLISQRRKSIETRNIEERNASAQLIGAGDARSRSSPAARRVRSVSAISSNREPPSRFRRSLRLECLSLRLASSEIVDGQGRCPWWASRASPSSATLRPAVTPTTPVGSLSGSSVELPSGSVRAEPTAENRAGTRPVPLVKAPLRAPLRFGLEQFTSALRDFS
jgi:hypothetical protein